jgi:hypothetical protein
LTWRVPLPAAVGRNDDVIPLFNREDAGKGRRNTSGDHGGLIAPAIDHEIIHWAAEE